MAAYSVTPSGRERFFDQTELIVSKTDTRGIITYANPVFQRVAGYKESELLGKPHSIVRHPDMPRCVFKYLWDTISSGAEVFAYVNNMAKNGDNYWVFAHVTPTYNKGREIVGYHSTRRVPERSSIEIMAPLYAALLTEEQRFTDASKGLESSFAMLVSVLNEKKVSYDEFIFSI